MAIEISLTVNLICKRCKALFVEKLETSMDKIVCPVEECKCNEYEFADPALMDDLINPGILR